MLRTLANLPLLGPVLGTGQFVWRNRGAAGAVWQDLRRTREEMSFLRALPVPSAKGRFALILALDESIYGVKQYAMLATGLRARGWRVAVLQDLRARLPAREVFRAFGFDEFHYLEDYAPDHAGREALAKAVADFAGRSDSFKTVKEWTFQGAWIGPQILSTLSRKSFGSPDLSDPEVHRQLLAALPGVLENVVKSRAAVAALRPDLALAIEANYSTFGPMIDAVIGAGAQAIQLTQPWKDDGMMLKRLTPSTRRMHPSSVSADTLRTLAAEPFTERRDGELRQAFTDRYGGRFFLQARNQPSVSSMGRAEIVRELGLDPDKPIATVFSHILWDANLFYGDDLFEDYADWFEQTVRAAAANDSVNWLIKLHPANLWKRAWENVQEEFAEIRLIREKIGSLPPHVHLLPADTKVSTFSLFEATDFGVTVRGTTGMELPCFGVPVLTAGTGRYSGLGFTEDSESTGEYLSRLARIHLMPRLSEDRCRLARVHAYAVFCRRPWAMQSFRSEFAYPKVGSHPLAHNLRAVASSWEDVMRNGDLDRFAAWAESSDVDYVEPER